MLPPRSRRQSLLVLFAVSLIVRGLTAFFQPAPRNLDEAYHTVNAITLARGGGFTENFFWNYLNPPPRLPQPGNLYWMPLTALIAAAGMAATGSTGYSAGQAGMVLLAALLPPLTWGVARQVTRDDRSAWLAALLMLFSGFYFPAWTVIDTFSPFALAGALCLYAAWRALETGDGRWAAAAGASAGLAHLTRADAPLLLAAVGVVFALRLRAASLRPLLRLGGIVLAAYLLVMLPWFWRNVQVTGAPIPPAGGKTIWLQGYNDMFVPGKELSWRTYRAWGLGPILRSKGWAAWLNLQTLAAVQGLIVAFPLAILGGWRRRGHPLFQLAGLYTLLLWLAMTLVFTFPGPRGAFFHSGGAILPFLFTAAAAGLDEAVAWAARRRRTWRARTARRVFGAGLVGFALFISLFVMVARRGAGGGEQMYPQIARRLAGEGATVMLGNPPAYLYYGGERAIPLPNAPLEAALQIADRYEAGYLALDANAPPPLRPYFTGAATHPRLERVATFGGGVLYRIEH